MPFMKKVVMGAAMCGTIMLGAAGARAQSGDFDGTNFTCLQYSNSLGENSSSKVQSGLARTWVLGYLAGYYKAKGSLQISDDAKAGDSIAGALASKCKDFPNGTIWAVTRDLLANDDRGIPKVATEGIDVTAYMCSTHVDAKAGSAADMMKSDIADLWAFAFIQGYKNFTNKDMSINMENKPVLTGAITKNCGKNLDKTFLDLTAMVAQAVKLQ